MRRMTFTPPLQDPKHPPIKLTTYSIVSTNVPNVSDEFNVIPVVVIEDITTKSDFSRLLNASI
ncbi:hypothetical protein FACS189449_09700 [Alphaproteobacteria bacterium]|nr:hypothetical protein FACS189449_09700 [Alphaproteobacteria bacterium]